MSVVKATVLINGLTETREVIVAKDVSFIENKDNCILCKDSKKKLISVIPFGDNIVAATLV
jgi:hypothetical protein